MAEWQIFCCFEIVLGRKCVCSKDVRFHQIVGRFQVPDSFNSKLLSSGQPTLMHFKIAWFSKHHLSYYSHIYWLLLKSPTKNGITQIYLLLYNESKQIQTTTVKHEWHRWIHRNKFSENKETAMPGFGHIKILKPRYLLKFTHAYGYCMS